MKERLLAAVVLGTGSIISSQADVANSYLDTPSKQVVERILKPEQGLSSKNSINISQLDPSEYPVSGRLFAVLVSMTIIAYSTSLFIEAGKLKSDPEIRYSRRATALLMASTALWVLAETAGDLPL